MRPPFLFAALSAVLLSSCYSPGDGVAPPLDEIYFPTGLALDVIPPMSATAPAPPAHLFVASSDFDLQYRASALASFDLNVLHDHYLPQLCNTDADCDTQHCDNGEAGNPTQDSHERQVTPSASYFCFDPVTNVLPSGLLQPCLPLAQQTSADQVLYPGHCKAIDPNVVVGGNSIITTAVQIGAFATDAVFRVPGLDVSGNMTQVTRGNGTSPNGTPIHPGPRRRDAPLDRHLMMTVISIAARTTRRTAVATTLTASETTRSKRVKTVSGRSQSPLRSRSTTRVRTSPSRIKPPAAFPYM